jgi:hypothetical protein
MPHGNDTLTPDMIAAVIAAVTRARCSMFESLEDQFPGRGMQLYAVGCADNLCILLNEPSIGPTIAQMVEERLRGTRYALTERPQN